MKLTKKQAEIRATILDQLYTKRPISRIDISKDTQITPATTGTTINELIKEGIVKELGELDDDSVGRKKTLLDIAGQQRFYLGIEISEKYLTAVIADNLGDSFASIYHPYRHEEYDSLTSQEIVTIINQFLKEHPQHHISAIAIALPGHVDLTESAMIISKSTHWSQLDLCQLQEAFDVPVYFSNKSHCITLAERLFGRHNKDNNFIVYHVARGIHCSYMYNGTIYGQDNFLIGEIGHTIINPEGELCPCGKKGCLQVYASEAALIEKASTLFSVSRLSLFKTLVNNADDIDLQTILDAYRLGDLGAINLINTACHYLAISITNLCQLIDTETIYLDGEIFSYPLITDHILSQIHQEKKLFPKQKLTDIKIKPYSESNIAQAAVSLCVYQDFLIHRRKL